MIVFLGEAESASMNDIIRKGGINQVSAYNAVKRLVELELGVEKKDVKWPFKRVVSLTPKGKRVGKLLKKLGQELDT
jgi:DNA-binding MarR family transcriptional regulator